MEFPNLVPGYVREGEPIFQLPPEELVPEVTIRADVLSEERDWGHGPLQLKELHDKGVRGAGVTVAVCDTGIDFAHPDLSPRKAPSGHKNFTTSNTADFADRQGHGSHCSGIVAASDTGDGIIGSAPEARLMAVKVLSDQGSGASTWINAGVIHAADSGADIISMSLGGGGADQDSLNAIRYAISKGCWVVVAAGNSGQGGIDYPGGYAECVTVAATDPGNNVASFSSRGRALDVAAPGVSILSTYPGNRYAKLSGTSMATPYVAGCLALVRGELKKRGMSIPSQAEIEKLSRETAKDLDAPGFDTNTGFGLIQPVALLAKLLAGTPVPPPPVNPPTPPQPTPGPGGYTGTITTVEKWVSGAFQGRTVTPNP